MPLIGTISGSNGTSQTAISGSLIIADEPGARFPSLGSGVKLFVSGTKTSVGADSPSAIFGGDTFISGAFGTDSYIQMKPVGDLRIPTNTTASYIYTSGSTNDLYFSQYQPGTGYTNTTRLRWLESTISTGLLHGGVLSTASGSATYSVTAGSGLIINQNASLLDDPYPTIQKVEWDAIVSSSLPSISTTQITYVAIDSTGTPFLQSTPFLDGDYFNYIVLGRILHTDKVGTNGAVVQPAVCYGNTQFRGDFVRAFGPIKISGHTFYTNGTQGLRKDAGDSYVEGRNYSVDPSSPNYIQSTSDTAQNTSKIFYEYVDAGGDDIIINNGNVGYTVLDFANYNNAGTLTSVGSGNKFTIQRVFWFPNSVNRAFFVYYGNTIYGTIAEAQAGIATEVFTEGKNTRDAAIFLGYAIVKGTGLDFADSTTFKIIQAGSFRAVASSGAGATGSPGGADTQVQFNDAGVFGGNSNFTFAKSTGTVSMANLIVSSAAAGSLVSSGTLQVKNSGGTVVGSISTGGVISGSSDLQIGGNITGSNAVLGGDLAVNGGDLTTTSSTLNLFDTNAATVNFARGASSLTIGAANSSATFQGDITGSNIRLTGDIAVVGGDLTSNAATFNIANLGVSTVNLGGGASTVNIGAASSVTALAGDLNIGGGGLKARFGPAQNLTVLHNTNAAIRNTSGQFLIQQEALNQRLEMQITGALGTGMFRVRNLPGTGFRDLLEVRNDGTILIGSATAGPTGLGSTTISNDLFLSTGILAVNTDTTSIQLVSSGNVTVKLDANNNAPGHFFAVVDNLGNNEFLVNENGNVDVSGNFVVSGSVFSTATTTTFNLLNTALTGTLNVGSVVNRINAGGTTTTSSFQGELVADGHLIVGTTSERVFNTSSAGNTLNFSLGPGNIFYVNNPTNNITANFTNVPSVNLRVITPTIILSQSATPRIVSAVQVDTLPQTINWVNGVTPSGTAGKQDVFGFSLIRSGSAWKVLGQMTSYG